MEIKVRIEILSHLSDAQLLGEYGFKDEASKHITYVKRLVTDYPDTEKYVSEKELSELWSKLFKPKGKEILKKRIS